MGTNPSASRAAAELTLNAETGDYTIVKPELLVRFATPLWFGVALGVEAAAGTVEGDTIPAQARWRLGGAPSLRGYRNNLLQGERYWRTRADLERRDAGGAVRDLHRSGVDRRAQFF